MGKLAAGDKAPAFSLPDQDGKNVSSKDFAGRQAVDLLLPPGRHAGLHQGGVPVQRQPPRLRQGQGARLRGLRRHRREAPEVPGQVRPDLPAADRRRPPVGEAYGAWGEKTLYGKKSVGVIRSTFLIGADGTIARPWYHVKADGHAAKVLAELEG